MKARRALYAQVRAEQTESSARFVDLRIDFVALTTKETLLSVGGRWDRKTRAFAGSARKRRALAFHDGQLEAVRWFERWLRGFVARRLPEERGRKMRSLLCAGGRRAGKSDFAIKAALAFAILVPASRVWIVSPTLPETEEVDLALVDIMPRAWYWRLGKPWFRFTLPNGSTITLRSASDPEALKRGRADFAVMNEAQRMKERAFAILRPALADKGGLLILTANPPEEAVGQWIAEFVEETQAGRRPAKYIHFDATKNPFADQGSLDDLALEVDERTYRVERLGEFLPRLDVVFHAWSPTLNVQPRPDVGEMTEEFTGRRFGRRYRFIAGFDFQLHPHMACVIFEAFRDPAAPAGEPLLWAVDFATVKGNEDELLDELERRGYVGAEVACVVDASGEWQDAERTRGRGSCDVLRRRKWGHVYLPDAKSKKNPDIVERVAATNARICTADKVRHVFSVPENLELNLALRKWERRNGAPYRKSTYAHLCDAFSYPLYRLYPRKKLPGPFRYDRIRPKNKGGWEEL